MNLDETLSPIIVVVNFSSKGLKICEEGGTVMLETCRHGRR
jgi:hypothetical protein